jgi:GNAT superfamily N-acetyltransferase
MQQTQVAIERLKPNSPELRIAAQWRHEAFLKDDGFSVADSEAQLAKISTEPQGCEVALIALIDGRIAGICMLVLHEIDPLHDHSPWLASLYIAPQFRKRGIARDLVRAIEDHARHSGVRRLHLYTVDAEEFYTKCGWSVVERIVTNGTPLVLMTRGL